MSFTWSGSRSTCSPGDSPELLGAIALTGPIVKAGDATLAAELLGFASTLTLLDNFWVAEREHATLRVRRALSPEAFDRSFADDQELTIDEVSNRLMRRLSKVEALVATTPRGIDI